MTAVPYPADTRAKGWRFEVDTEKVKASETWLRAKSGALRGALLLLWAEAWQQTPCGSLPDSDELIALLIDMPAATFAKHRTVLMRGWSRADDGRLYHDTITARVLAMLEKRAKDTSRKTIFDKRAKAIKERDGNACVYCAATTYLSIDRLISISRGGGSEDSNLVTACRSCNSIKGARNPDEAGLTFANTEAERLWHAVRDHGNALPTRYQQGVTQPERVPNATKHQAPGPSKEKEKAPRKRAAAAPEFPRPDDVAEQVWCDWLKLRKDKRASVSGTVMTEARSEASKAGLTLERFLAVWCIRGTQGLQADWLRPNERNPQSFRERDASAAAEQVKQWTGGLLDATKSNSNVIDMEAPRVAQIGNS